jgi:opacity protein-like surface antigen
MRSSILATLLLAAAATASAQTNSVTFSILQPQYSSASARVEGEKMPIAFNTRSGFRLGYSHSIGRGAFDIDVARISAPASATFPEGTFGVGTLTLTPISATVSLHGGSGRFDTYIGAGAAYVMTGDLHSDEMAAQGVDRIGIGNDLTYVVNAGAGVAMSPAVSLTLDARYMPVGVSATVAGSPQAEVKFNALTWGAGLRWRF